jgi:TolA protein
MKGSVITSIVLHGLLLVWLLVSFGSAKPLEVTAGEALPVELITDMSQLQEGDKEAPVKDKAAKDVTKNEPKVDNALNAGDNNFDLKSVPKPEEKPSNVQKAAAAKKSDVVAPQDTQEQQSADNVKEDTAVNPDTEVAALEKPVDDVMPEPKPEEKPVEKPAETAKDEPLPDAVPIPTTRPKEEPKKVEEKKEEPKKVEEKKVEEKKDVKVTDAKTDKDKKAKKDKDNKKAKKSTTSKDSDFNSNEIAELLNKVDNQAGGARRNKNAKARGAETTNSTAQKLSQSEMDALKGMIEDNWTIMPGQVTTGDIAITVHFELDQDGNLVGRPEIVKTSGGDGSSLQALSGGAVRAVMKSAPFDKLPKDKYDTWKTVQLTFYPSPT